MKSDITQHGSTEGCRGCTGFHLEPPAGSHRGISRSHSRLAQDSPETTT